jgi:2,5-diketo-D-gluconate reductase A
MATIATMSDSTIPDDSVVLTNGTAMPLLGFGTWQITGDDVVPSVSTALEVGYRHLDTAHVYGNEAEVGSALAASGVSRDDVFLTTKCPPDRAADALDVLQQSLELLQTDHLDLWLIHWPGEGSVNPDLWQKFVEARQSGLTREIGVSNFDAELIDEVTAAAGGVKPAVNQIEWSPLLFDAATVAAHRERDIVLEGYSGLRGGTLDHPAIVAIADRLGRTAAQVIVRWHLQHGFVAIPKSVNADRIRSNAQVADFELTADDVAALDALGAS